MIVVQSPGPHNTTTNFSKPAGRSNYFCFHVNGQQNIQELLTNRSTSFQTVELSGKIISSQSEGIKKSSQMAKLR
jgi:hypothetical protein